MGYTHYMSDIKLTEEIVSEAQAIIDTSPVKIVTEFHLDEKPEVSMMGILLNGYDEDSCETFVIRPYPEPFTFCKTERRPYDEVVSAILISVMLHDAGHVSSDGMIGEDDEWDRAVELYGEARGRTMTEEEIEKVKDHLQKND